MDVTTWMYLIDIMPRKRICTKKRTCDSFYTKFKNHPTWKMMTEVTAVFTSGDGGTGVDWEVVCGNLWGAGNILYLDLSGGYTGLYMWKIPQTVHWRCKYFMYFTVCVLLLLFKKIFPTSSLNHNWLYSVRFNKIDSTWVLHALLESWQRAFPIYMSNHVLWTELFLSPKILCWSPNP